MVLKKDNNKLHINNIEENAHQKEINRFFSEENEKKYTQNQKVYAEFETLKVVNTALNNNESDTIKKHHIFSAKHDNLMFNLKFVLTHNKLLILIWVIFFVYCIVCSHTLESKLAIFASLIILTGILYTSFSKNLENGMYEREINLILNIMRVIIKNINKEYSPIVQTHDGLIRAYEENKQNKEDYLLGAYEQHKVINNLSCILDTPEIVYLPADLKEEIQSLNDKNTNIMNALFFYLKTLCIKNIKTTKVYLRTENKLYDREYKGFFLRVSMIHYWFDENEIDILNNKLNLNINKEVANSILLFDVDEKFEELNTLIDKIHYLAFKKVNSCTKFNVFS